MKETDVAEPIMRWLESQGWDCYPEAQFIRVGTRADIAAVKNRKLWIIEAKTSLSLALINQAYLWTDRAHFVSIGVPAGRRGTPEIARMFLRQHGIGLLRVDIRTGCVFVNSAPRLSRAAHRSAGTLISQLHPDMKRYAPGGVASDGFSTPWRRTMDRVVEFIRRHHGCGLKDVMDGVNHHYASDASARSSIPFWLRESECERIRVVCDGRRMKFYPIGAEVASERRKAI